MRTRSRQRRLRIVACSPLSIHAPPEPGGVLPGVVRIKVVLHDLDSVLVSGRAHRILTCTSCKRLENDLSRGLAGGEVILSFGRVSERVSCDVDLQRAISDPREQVLESERNVLKAALQRVAAKRDILFQEMSGEPTGGGSCGSLISHPVQEPTTECRHRRRSLFQVGKGVEIDAYAFVLRR